MKKIKKSLFSVCLSISFMFGCLAPSISVLASGDVWSSAESYHYFENNFDDINTRLNGVIINQNGLREDFEDFVEEYRENYNISSGTSTSTWIGDNISGTYQNGSSGVADLEFSQTFRQAMRDWCSAYIESNTGYKYVYSTQTASYVSKFSDQDQYHAWLDLINEYDSTSSIVLQPDNYWNITYVVTPQEGKRLDFVFSSGPSYGAYNVIPYCNWNNGSDSGTHKRYDYNSTTKVYELTSEGTGINVYDCKLKSNPSQISYGNCPVHLNTTQYIMYMTYDSMKNGQEGIQDYYTVQDSYNSTISGSYNTTTNNIQNTLNNSDVSNYINNYYVQSGSYPSPNQINIYITQNIDNGSSGGSGGSGDDDNKPNWDFSFLGTLGELLAELISGLGEIVGGILSAITSIISSLREGIPNTIGLFLEWFFPFLPTEIVALIELSILCAVIIGVVRLIRGH